MQANVSLDQLRAFQAVVEHGGFAQAAEALHRSQSSVSYQVNRLQLQLGIALLETRGRKAALTDAGEAVLKQARQMLREQQRLGRLVESLREDWEPAVHLVVDTAFPAKKLMQALQLFAPVSRGTRVRLTEVVLSGAEDALLSGEADLAIAARAPQGWLGEQLLTLDFIAVAHPAHALHRLQRELTVADLETHTQVVINDSGSRSKMDVGWLGAEHQWSVSRIETAVIAITHGLGFGWLPEHVITDDSHARLLKKLPLRDGSVYSAGLQLVHGNQEHPGPACRQLADCIVRVIRSPDAANTDG